MKEFKYEEIESLLKIIEEDVKPSEMEKLFKTLSDKPIKNFIPFPYIEKCPSVVTIKWYKSIQNVYRAYMNRPATKENLCCFNRALEFVDKYFKHFTSYTDYNCESSAAYAMWRNGVTDTCIHGCVDRDEDLAF